MSEPSEVESRLMAVEERLALLDARVRENRRGLDANSLGSIGFFTGFVCLTGLLLVVGLQIQYDSSTGLKGSYQLPLSLLVEAAALPVVGAVLGALIPSLRSGNRQ